MSNAVTLVAQHVFNHELLFALVEAGALTQQQAASVVGTCAEKMRGSKWDDDKQKIVADKMADSFELIAAGILGLRKIEK